MLWSVGNDLRFVLIYYKSDCTLYFLWVPKFIFVNALLVILCQVYVNVIISLIAILVIIIKIFCMSGRIRVSGEIGSAK